jgi:cell division protein FtsI/penicillin-binding protein 2
LILYLDVFFVSEESGMSAEEVAALQEKMKDNPFVSLQEHFSSYYKINKDTESSAHYISPIQYKLPLNAAGKECPFQYVPIIETLSAIVSDRDFKTMPRTQTGVASSTTSRMDLLGETTATSGTTQTL